MWVWCAEFPETFLSLNSSFVSLGSHGTSVWSQIGRVYSWKDHWMGLWSVLWEDQRDIRVSHKGTYDRKWIEWNQPNLGSSGVWHAGVQRQRPF